MTLRSGEHSVRLRVEKYQFAEATNEHDANWLVVGGEIRLGARRWRFSDPCLLTWELESLLAFLRLAADDPSTPRTITFLEPLLAFTWNGFGELRVALGRDAKPKELRVDEEPIYVDVPCSPDDLRRIGGELELECRRFPRRAVL